MEVAADTLNTSTRSADATADATPVAALIDELRHDDVSLRIHAIQELPRIAKAIGEERTRTELLPFVLETIDDEDEVLLALAGQLDERFLPYVGGKDYLSAMLEPLEQLAQVEETVVRERAVESILSLARCCEPGEHWFLDAFYPLLKRLAEGDWFTSRISATALFATTYAGLVASETDARAELRSLFLSLAKDDTPMVRRAAASHLAEFAAALEPVHVSGFLLKLFAELAEDDQDSVRLLVVENAEKIVSLLPETDRPTLFALVLRLAADKSWRVRYLVADRLSTIKPDGMVGIFCRLLRDGEAEVRTAAALKLADVVRAASSEATVQELVPVMKELVHDANQHVRTAVAGSILALAPIMGRSHTLQVLFPLVLILLKDDCPDVRLGVISNLDQLSAVVGIERLVSDLLPAIVELAEDRNWRVRLAIIQHMASLAKQLGRQYFDLDRKLGLLCVAWLTDAVYAVREAAIKNLAELVRLFGASWAIEQAIPCVQRIFETSTSYLYRITALQAMGELATVLDPGTNEKYLLPLLVQKASSDPVPNVRLVTAKTLMRLAPYISKQARMTQLRPALEAHSSASDAETDVDVAYQADKALVHLSAMDQETP
jgi:serine/threonine-protein phosphatase 2A regulatory subunit A